MRATVVTLAELTRRGSWLPRDFIYETGDVVFVDGRRAVVARREDRRVFVSYVETVPGSSTAFCCSTPVEVEVYDIERRADAARRVRRTGA